MGTYWTSGTYAFTLDLRALDGRKCFSVPAGGVGWELARTVELVDKDEGAELSSKHTMPEEQTTVLAIQRIKIESPEAFGKMLQASKPVILEGIDLGAIKHNWSLDYLADKIGRDRKVGCTQLFSPPPFSSSFSGSIYLSLTDHLDRGTRIRKPKYGLQRQKLSLCDEELRSICRGGQVRGQTVFASSSH